MESKKKTINWEKIVLVVITLLIVIFSCLTIKEILQYRRLQEYEDNIVTFFKLMDKGMAQLLALELKLEVQVEKDYNNTYKLDKYTTEIPITFIKEDRERILTRMKEFGELQSILDTKKEIDGLLNKIKNAPVGYRTLSNMMMELYTIYNRMYLAVLVEDEFIAEPSEYKEISELWNIQVNTLSVKAPASLKSRLGIK